MANYRMAFGTVDGKVITIDTSEQPDNITDFMNKAVRTDWNLYVNDSDHATTINMHNVVYIAAERK